MGRGTSISDALNDGKLVVGYTRFKGRGLAIQNAKGVKPI